MLVWMITCIGYNGFVYFWEMDFFFDDSLQVRESKCIHVSLVGADDPSIPTDGLANSRWQGYLNTFVMTYPTEWLPAAPKEKRSPVMLKR